MRTVARRLLAQTSVTATSQWSMVKGIIQTPQQKYNNEAATAADAD